jgi:hypothetical protein
LYHHGEVGSVGRGLLQPSRTFKGLTSTAKARAVCATLQDLRRLSDFEREDTAVGRLLEAMHAQTQPAKPTILGRVDEAHYHRVLDGAFGVKRWWFRRAAFDHTGVPWVVEVAVAETLQAGGTFFAVNYSPTFEDPLRLTRLVADDIQTSSAVNFLWRTNAAQRPLSSSNPANRAVVIHLICPALEFADRGKTHLRVPDAVAERISGVLWGAVKELHAEQKRWRRDAARAERQAELRERNRRPTRSLRDAVFAVMEDAIAAASGQGRLPFPVRSLYYQVRPRIQRFTSAELRGEYFSQKLVVAWQREHRRIPGMFRDPRGYLREPHTGLIVPLGTREVAEYQFPAYGFNKILYVEKELWPTFAAARLAERYDMAIVIGKGEPVEAVRALFERAEAGDYQIFALHDADPYGYSIKRTVSEATDRMPDYQVEVIDLGLTVADALGQANVEEGQRVIAEPLPTEVFTRSQALPRWMRDRLTDQERAWFEGRRLPREPGKPQQWACTRVELNALSAPQLIRFIEAGLAPMPFGLLL